MKQKTFTFFPTRCAMKIVFLVDKTASMTYFLEALLPTIQELRGFLNLFFNCVEFNVCFYSDYAFNRVPIEPVVIHCPFSTNPEPLEAFINLHKKPQRNDDNDEAQLTAIMHLLENNLLDDQTLLIHFTDAFPHLPNSVFVEYNSKRELDFFQAKTWDWNLESIAVKLRATGCTMISFIDDHHYSTNPRGYDKTYGPFGSVVPCLKSKILSTVTTSIQELMLSAASFVSIKFSDIRKNITTNPGYFAKCVAFFNDQLDRRALLGALDIFGNRITAELYRSVILRRDDQAVVDLKNRFSRLDTSGELRQLMDASFGRLEIFDDKMLSALPTLPQPLVFFTPSSIQKLAFPPKNLQSLFSSFDRVNVSHFKWFIGTLQEISADPDFSNVQPSALVIVPRDVPDYCFFSMLTHLISPGYIANQRQAAIVALLSLGADYAFRTRARNYLCSVVGKWLNFETDALGKYKYPENFAVDFVRFLLQAKHRDFLTADEHRVIYSAAGARHLINLPKNITVTVSTKPRLLELSVQTFKCTRCHINRPGSIRVMGSYICGFCHSGNGGPCHEPTEIADVAQHVTCEKCRGIYALVRPDIFIEKKYSAKCFYCFNNQKAPLVECSCCLNKWIMPTIDRSTLDRCALCVEEKIEFSPVVVELNRLFGTNGLRDSLAVRKTRVVAPGSYWQREINTIHNQMLTLPNGDAIFEKNDIRLYLQYVPKEALDCTLCCEEVDPHCGKLSICGMAGNAPVVRTGAPNCTGVVCTACVYRLWDFVMPGCIVELSAVGCPFCRRAICPKSAANHQIKNLIILENSGVLARQNTMAWCVTCNTLKVLASRACGEHAADVAGFVCTDCRPPRVSSNVDRVFYCLRCSAVVCKQISTAGVVNTGCNHVECVACGAHLCAFAGCFRDFDEAGDVYDHMTAEHGGYYDA